MTVFGGSKAMDVIDPEVHPTGPMIEGTVQPGDTLWDITDDIDGSEDLKNPTIELVEEMNPNLSNPLQTGETYIIPSHVEKK